MEETTIVFDGSDRVKVGYAGDECPRIVFSTVVGVEAEAEAETEKKLILRNPIQHGIVNNWDDMEKIYHYAFNNLGIAPEEHPVLLTEPPLNPKTNCDKKAEMMFEKFNVPALYVAEQSKLALYARCHHIGVVVSCGDGLSCVVPFYEWKTIHHAVHRMDIGGRDLDEHLATMMRERGYDFTTSEVARELKEQVCYVALDYNQEMENGKSNPTDLERNYVLPDRRVMTIGEERFRCPEALFQPNLLGLDTISDVGIHEMTNKSISKCDELGTIREEMYANIVMNGGSTMFAGMENRMCKEITALAPTKTHIEVVAPPDRKYRVWMGGSILGSLSHFKEVLVSKEEYNEFGPSIVYKKCLSS